MKPVAEVNGKGVPPRRNGYYVIDEQRVYPSVTTILNAVAKQQYLIPWAARQVFERLAEDPSLLANDAASATGLVYAVRDAAGIRGTTIHSWAEAVKCGAPIDWRALPEALQGYGHAFDEWVHLAHPVILCRELRLFSDTHRIAGTTDMIVLLGDQERSSTIVDIKTSKNLYDEFDLQMSAYRVMANDMIHAGALRIPPVDSTRLLHLRPNGSFECRETPECFEIFLSVKKVWEWQTGHKEA